MAKKIPPGFRPPETVEKAFNFGRANALRGSAMLSRRDVVPSQHPHPTSIWRAYVRGWNDGRPVYIRRLARTALELNVAPPCRNFQDSGELGRNGHPICERCGYTRPQHYGRSLRRSAWIQEILEARREEHGEAA